MVKLSFPVTQIDADPKHFTKIDIANDFKLT